MDQNRARRSVRDCVRDATEYPLGALHALVAHDDQLHLLLLGHGHDSLGDSARHRVRMCFDALGAAERGDALQQGVRDAERVDQPGVHTGHLRYPECAFRPRLVHGHDMQRRAQLLRKLHARRGRPQAVDGREINMGDQDLGKLGPDRRAGELTHQPRQRAWRPSKP